MQSITGKMSEFICGLTYEKIPPTAVKRIKISLLDTLGCALSGSQFEWARAVNDFVESQQGVPEATLWATPFKGPAANVALGNGTMIHSFDFDGYFHKAKLHPSAAVIPAAFAVGEKEQIDGKKLITAVAAGFETMSHIGRGINPAASRARGWHLTGTCGTFGAAAAAGRIWDFDQQAMTSALGMAGTQSAGLWAFTADGSESKRFHPGRAAQSGIIAAALAQRGYRGPAKIIEADDGGFFKATSENFDMSIVLEGLGEVFDCEAFGIKPHAACASLHSSVDAALGLRDEHRFSVEDIEKVHVYNSELVNLQCGFEYAPMGALQAQMSMQYCVARALMDGMLFLDQFSEKKLAEPAALDLAGRVIFVLDEEINRIYPREYPSVVEIIMKDGRKLKARVNMPKGSPANPVTWEDVQQKFTMLSLPVIGEQNVAALVEMIAYIETVRDVGKITDLLGK